MSLLIHNTSATQGAPLGEDLSVPPNRLFRYARNGPQTLAVGTVLQATRPNTSHANMTCAAAPAGAYALTVTLDRGDPTVVDEYKNGYIYVNDEAGEGFLYDVVGHPGGGGEDTTKKITIRDPLVVALTTSSQATLIKNIYDGVNRPYGDPWDIIAGITPVSVPADHYFWCQVRGPAVVLQEGGLFAGRGVMLSQRKSGAVEVLKQVIPVRPAGSGRELRGGTSPQEAPTFTQKAVKIRHLTDRLLDPVDPEVLTVFSGQATIPERVLGYCINPRVGSEHALIYLTLS